MYFLTPPSYNSLQAVNITILNINKYCVTLYNQKNKTFRKTTVCKLPQLHLNKLHIRSFPLCARQQQFLLIQTDFLFFVYSFVVFCLFLFFFANSYFFLSFSLYIVVVFCTLYTQYICILCTYTLYIPHPLSSQ